MSKYNERKISPSLSSKLLSNIDYNVIKEVKIGKDYTYSILNTSDLKVLNLQLVEEVLSQIPLNNSCVGFVKNKSYLDLLEPHRFSRYFTRLDISSFFHSISPDIVRSALSPYIQPKFLDKEKKILTLDKVMQSITYKVPNGSKNTKLVGKEILPMGYPSSPVVSNIVFRKIDIQIQKFCLDNDIIYTRYADDMLFSSSKNLISKTVFFEKIKSFLSQLSLNLNEKKTITTQSHISLNGYVIDGDSNFIRLSNSKLSKVNKLTHQIMTKKLTVIQVAKNLYGYDISSFDFKYGVSPVFFEQYCKDQIFNKLTGNRSYLISLIKYDDKHHCVCPDYVTKSKKVLKRLDDIIQSWY